MTNVDYEKQKWIFLQKLFDTSINDQDWITI